MNEPPDIFRTHPLYAVLFSSSQDINDLFSPIVVSQRPDPIVNEQAFVTVPHGLSRDMAAALSGLWYCLHLPNTFFQLMDLPYSFVKHTQILALDHQFFFAPVRVFDSAYIPEWPLAVTPVLALCPDDLLNEVSSKAQDLGFLLPAASFSELSDFSLKAHWRAIHEAVGSDVPYLGHELDLTRRLDLSATSLPARWLARQVWHDSTENVNGQLSEIVDRAQLAQAYLAAYANLEREGSQFFSQSQRSEAVVTEYARLRVPVTIGMPGVAAAYSRQVYSALVRRRIQPISATDHRDTWSPDMANRSDFLVERSTIELLTAHHAIARTGTGLMLESVPAQAFVVLAELERHFTATPKGSAIARLLSRLNEAAAPIWTEPLIEVIAGAAALHVFSNFPIGLLTYPGDTSPLVTRLPITYQPLNPLSRIMQSELAYTVPVNLSRGYSVLVAECISADDPVGVVSRIAWDSAREFVTSGGYPITFEVVECSSIARLNEALDTEPDIVVISAHGTFRPQSNLAGLMIGNEICLGPELGDLPPVVILSACHVAPRGLGPVSIADLLLRQGALAVLGTQVPVDVTRNALLMARLFLYLAETLAKRESFSTLLDAWHFIQMSNAVYDVLNGSKALYDWGLTNVADGRSVLAEFLGARSAGQLHRGNLYRDTERVLGQIADEQGIGDKVRNWFRQPGYVPETLFYVMAGKPERVYLRDPTMTLGSDKL
jgi:CHAT domain